RSGREQVGCVVGAVGGCDGLRGGGRGRGRVSRGARRTAGQRRQVLPAHAGDLRHERPAHFRPRVGAAPVVGGDVVGAESHSHITQVSNEGRVHVGRLIIVAGGELIGRHGTPKRKVVNGVVPEAVTFTLIAPSTKSRAASAT